jgi:hypothetical protein
MRKKKTMRKIILISFLALILSCNSDDDSGLSNSRLKVTRIDQFSNNNSIGTTLFEYNEELRLIAQKDGSGNVIFTYNYENEKITSIISNGSTTIYNYNGDLISSASNSDNNSLAEYEYNSLEQLATSKNYENGILQCEINYTYNNEDNIETVNNSCFNSGSGPNNFEYDNMKNQNSLLFNSGLLKIFAVGFGNNNITMSLDNNSNVLYTVTYEYNNQGYPTVSITTIPDIISGSTSTFRNEYTYENL